MRPYEIIEHTADIGLRAYGKTLAEAFSNAAKGMFAIITDNSRIDSVGQYMIKLKSSNIEQLLVDWLSELLFLHDVNNLVFGEFKVRLDESRNELKADVFGEEYSREKHGYGEEIKAVTYYMLKVSKRPPYVVQIIFDI